MVGLMLTVGVLALRESMDNTIKTTADVEKLLGLSTIGYIPEMQSKEVTQTGAYLLEQPHSSISEAFRSMRTNIEFSAIDKPIRTLLITSPEPETGKTTIAANLAFIFAQKERRVMLMDADLRRPHIHLVMGLEKQVGLTDLLLDSQNLDTVSHPVGENGMVRVITSGSLPPNPAELLGSGRMEHTLSEISANVDIVIIDSPPLIVADAQVLAAKVDAVLLVIRQGKTQRDTARHSIDLLSKTNARIIGVVLNRISRGNGNTINASNMMITAIPYHPKKKRKGTIS
jgi:non-specific protein-tyrosine kinase